MEKPLVSIVVISYNQAKYIEENLNSIKAQTYKNIELIVADDASQDNSVNVFDNWLKDYDYQVKKNYHSKNTGLVTVLNECIEMASGKYIKLIAADDCLEPNYIEKCLNVLLENKADIVFTNAKQIDDENNIIQEDYFRVPRYDNLEELVKLLLLGGNFISGSSMITTTALYSKLGKYSSDILLEDYNLVLKALKKNIFIYYLNENLVRYRRHSSNITIKRFSRLEVETIKEKIKFDETGEYSNIIHNNIREQNSLKNKDIMLLKNIYFNYKGFNWKFYLLNFYPIIKKVCFQ